MKRLWLWLKSLFGWLVVKRDVVKDISAPHRGRVEVKRAVHHEFRKRYFPPLKHHGGQFQALIPFARRIA